MQSKNRACAKRQAEWERQQRELEVQEAIRKQKEREQKHAEALATMVKGRRENLLKAAERWRLSSDLIEFVNECERRWKLASGELNAEQQSWLNWAKEYTQGLSPFAVDYPNPVIDGAFDAAAIPFGGPYPATRNFSRPSSTQILPPPSAPSMLL